MTITAIQTWYGGCYFRSRLEARWAVFFDALGIHWQYEAQGYECGWRLKGVDGTFPYLPDFWLPGLGLHAEVKGSLTWPEADRLLNAIAYLSCAGGGGCHDSGGNDSVVLGPIPKPDERSLRAPTVLHMHKGGLAMSHFLESDRESGRYLASDASYEDGTYDLNPDFYPLPREQQERLAINILINGSRAGHFPDAAMRRAVARGYAAARSARFEHGESGALVGHDGHE